MQITRYSGIEGAEQADGIILIIDVFRAGNTILSCFNQGAEAVIPVGDLDRAYELKKEHPDYILAGERKSFPPEGFNLGNSPVEASKKDMQGKTIILTTSAGTQGIVHAGNPEKIFIATFANADKVVKHVNALNPEKVSIVAMGFEGGEQADEDELCAFYLELKFHMIGMDDAVLKEKLRQSKGAERLNRIGKTEDLEYCMRFNIIDIIPEYDFQKKVLYPAS
jgi:2-phosphosulfolactate phosphatase